MQMEEQRDALASERAEFEEWKREREAEIARDRQKAASDLEKAEKKAQSIMQSARASSDFIMSELNEVRRRKESENLADDLEKARDKVRRALRRADEKFNPVLEDKNEDYVLPRPLRVGDRVLIVNIGREGVVSTAPDKDGNLTVRAGIINTKTKVANLRLIEEETTVTTGSGVKRAAREFRDAVSDGIRAELDLRGNNGDDAWYATDKYLDRAIMAGLHTVTLIHGKGTGALKTSLRNNLRRDKRVKSFREGAYGEGDGGVTVVELK